MFSKLRRANRAYLKKPWYYRLLISVVAFFVIIVVTQDFQIFPGAFIQLTSVDKPLPERVESTMIDTEDGKRLEMWRLPAAVPRTGKLRAALVFHGNAGDIRNFFTFQKWLADIGYNAYAFDFRGFGKSTGWPSEAGIEKDADAALAHLLKREQLQADQVILFGISVGTVPAVYLASREEPGALVLLAPFPNLAEVVRTLPLFRPLVSLLWYEMPTEKRVAGLKKTCFIVAHGKPDEVIPFRLGKQVAEAYRGTGHNTFIQSESAHHNDIMNFEALRVKAAIEQCEETRSP